MTQTQRITEAVYARYNPERLDLTITPLEVVLMAELSDQIRYPHTHALNEGPNTSTRIDWNKMCADVTTWLGLNALCAGVVVCAGWLLFEAFHALAQMVTALFGLL